MNSRGDKAWDVMLQAAEQLAQSNIPSAREEAESLLVGITGWDRSTLYIDPTKTLSLEGKAQFDQWVTRRSAGEPFAHIVGYRDFWEHRFKVTADTLIPRADSETLVDAVLSLVGRDQAHRIVDLGTGTGCLLLSLLHEMPNATGVGVDVNAKALKVAASNAEIVNCADRVEWCESDWFAKLDKNQEPFTIVISNPPYIPANDILGLESGVKDFEPNLALDGGEGGLDCYEKILHDMPGFISKDSLVVFEVGIHQANDVGIMMKSMGLRNIKNFKDLGQIDRVVSGIFA